MKATGSPDVFHNRSQCENPILRYATLPLLALDDPAVINTKRAKRHEDIDGVPRPNTFDLRVNLGAHGEFGEEICGGLLIVVPVHERSGRSRRPPPSRVFVSG